MKIIITEEQYDRVINNQSRMWIRRNFNLIKKELDDTFGLTKEAICRYDTYEDFEYYFFAVFMDCLHPYYWDIDYDIFKGLEFELTDLFYVECTEFYFAGREKC